MIYEKRNSPSDRWPPIKCSLCGGRLIESDSDKKGYLMCQCSKCQHCIYLHVKGRIIRGEA
jgi:hypothetical protein